MNARIGGDFTSLLYIALTSSVFLYKLPIREGGAWPLTLPPPSLTIPPPSLSVTLPACAHPPDPNPPLPPNTDGQLRSPWMRDKNCGGGGGFERSNSSHPPSTDFSVDRLSWGGMGWLGFGGLDYHAPTPG